MRQIQRTVAILLIVVVAWSVLSYFTHWNAKWCCNEIGKKAFIFPSINGIYYGIAGIKTDGEISAPEIEVYVQLVAYNTTLLPIPLNPCSIDSDYTVLAYDMAGNLVDHSLSNQSQDGECLGGCLSKVCASAINWVAPFQYTDQLPGLSILDLPPGMYDLTMARQLPEDKIPKQKPSGPSLRITVK